MKNMDCRAEPPWGTKVTWQTVNRDLDYLIRYWKPKGCVLPRMSRPWICTWYLCPTQKAILEC
jgi:hypothetical protein